MASVFAIRAAMETRLANDEAEKLLSDLCMKLGFCLPLPLPKRMVNNPPPTVDRFADAVYKGEGLDPSLKSPLYYQVHTMVAKAFEQHEQRDSNQTV